jgi:hypothetical protein
MKQHDDLGYYEQGGGRSYYRPNPHVQRVDHNWFAAHPSHDEYVRFPLPGEFDGRLPPLHPGCQWMVHVTAWRDPITGHVMMRIRHAIQVLEGQS